MLNDDFESILNLFDSSVSSFDKLEQEARNNIAKNKLNNLFIFVIHSFRFKAQNVMIKVLT